MVNPVVKVDPWLVDQRVNYGLKNRPLKVILELTGTASVVQREEQWPVVVKGWVKPCNFLLMSRLFYFVD